MIENGQLPDFIACIGDDRSNKDMFKSITNTAPNTPEIFACTVGRKPRKAKYYLDDTVDVVKLLSGLANASNPKPINTPARFQVSFDAFFEVKENQEKNKIETKPGKNGKRNVEDKILVPKPPKNCTRCATCGHPVNGSYCQGCTLLREKLEEDLVTYFQNFQNTSESSDDSTNVVNAPRELVVVK
uniref:Probable alpha,alpha-trehalose-phosphate synthase [UDP-forming] 10 n=1 Tax=Tanacetum cinerariifolium TaxID=118510 RepID=A0A6L2KDP0_TANCI|nr:probable alpha,alpha-trehalose-phosphate synthase [UDP-forming] 10 [Tanacetum cinerariifolium]